MPAVPGTEEMVVEGSADLNADMIGETVDAPLPLLEYSKAEFDAAIASDKLIVLYFFANWCPECREEYPKMQAAFAELSGDDVIGFRVNFNDSETTPDEQALAREYGVAYQHTKVFVKNGARVLKSPETWQKERYILEINTYR